jgi:hypothetical protein
VSDALLPFAAGAACTVFVLAVVIFCYAVLNRQRRERLQLQAGIRRYEELVRQLQERVIELEARPGQLPDHGLGPEATS